MRPVASGRWPPALAAIAGVALTGVAALGVAPRWDAASLHAELDALGESRRLAVQMALTDLAELLQAMSGQLARLGRPVVPADFDAFAADLAHLYGGAVELGWIAPVDAPVALARADDAARLRFAVAFRRGPRPSAEGADDPRSAAAERAVLELALERGALAAGSLPVATGRVDAVAFVPVRATGDGASRASGRPGVVAGLVRCRVDPGGVVEHVLRGVRVARGLDLHLFARDAAAADLPVHVRGSVLRTAPAPARTLSEVRSGPHWQAEVAFADVRWSLVATPIPGGPLATGHGRGWAVAVAGLLLTALLVAYVATVGVQERRLGHAVSASRIDAAAARYRGELLHAIAAAAKELAAGDRIDEAVARALRAVGEAALVDRVVVLESVAGGDGRPAALVTRHVWRSALAPAVLPGEPVGTQAEDGPERHLLAFAEGRPYAAVVAAMPSSLREYLQRLGVRSVLLVPMEVEGRPWGALTLDDCTTDREWTAAEIDILKTLSDLVAASITRARHVKELADANTIVENSTTVLYRLRGEAGLPMSYVSRNVAALGHDPDALLRDPRSYLALVHPEDVERVGAGFDRVLAGEAGAENREFRLRVWGGSWRWFESRHGPVRDAAGRVVEIEGVLVDVTERKKAEERIALMARTDALTGIANRATFVERLELAFASAARNRRPFSVLYLDLDRFKEVNDTLGHAAGDELIAAAARRLGECTRKTDLVARLGGDEFAVLQADVADAAGAGALARKICDGLSAPYEIAGRPQRITVSVGIAQWTPDVRGPEDLLVQADRALYLAKQEGRDRFRFHSEALDAQARLDAALGDELRDAVARDELELYYQPQVDLATGRIVGMEALARWRHPARGLLAPADFLAVAERTGVMLPIGRWVLDRACAQMGAWRAERVAPDLVAVNLSLAQLRTGLELVDAVSSALARWDVPPEALELDVTEAMLSHASTSGGDVLERLRALGVRIAVDDFGTQSSSLEVLRSSRVTRLTISRSILAAAERDGHEAATVRAIVAIARELGLGVVAQGIETDAQRELLASAGAAVVGQGFLFSRPVPAARATDLLRAPGLGPGARGAIAPAALSDAAPR